MTFEAYLRARQPSIDAALERLLPPPEGPAGPLASAMRYAVLGGGKRLRPALALACCEACGGRVEDALEPAAALEMIHAYSLAHDDLPCMDDDDLRRGRPTLHRVYGEAAAILAGDALLTLAFEILAARPEGAERASRRLEAVAAVARRAGADGMVGGQIADIEAEARPIDGARLEWIHRHKTGALMAAAAETGAIHAGAPPDRRAALARFGEAVGLAFQVADDILDRTATAHALGKTPGKDQRSDKATYPALFGLEAAHREAARLADAAIAHLENAGVAEETLRSLPRYAVARKA